MRRVREVLFYDHEWGWRVIALALGPAFGAFAVWYGSHWLGLGIAIAYTGYVWRTLSGRADRHNDAT